MDRRYPLADTAALIADPGHRRQFSCRPGAAIEQRDQNRSDAVRANLL